MRSILFALSFLLLLTTSQSQAQDVTKEKIYKTPQAVFDVAKKAMKKKDYGTFIELLTDKSIDKMAESSIQMALMMIRGNFPGDDPKTKAIGEKARGFLEKQGVTQALQQQLLDASKKGDNKLTALTKDLFKKHIKDRKKFLTGLYKLFIDLQPAQPPEQDFQLVDLTISGNTAKGNIVMMGQGGNHKEPILFKKVGRSWKMEIPEDEVRMKKAAPPNAGGGAIKEKPVEDKPATKDK